MKPKPFKIFRVGKHTDSAGRETEFTADQLAATVKAYNEGEWRAPMVVGHPQGHAPAYGWIGSLQLSEAGDVIADTDKLNADFAQLMADGAYRNRSASWYAPDHPSNPTPGVWQLRHLGMLGAQPPALKGLGDVEFHDDAGLTLEFASSDYTTSTIGQIFRRLRDTLISKWGVEETDKALPSFLVEDIEAAGRATAEATIPNYSETEDTTMTPEQIAALQAEAAKAATLQADLDAEKAKTTALTGQVQSFEEAKKTSAAAVALVAAKGALQPLVTAGKLLPAQLDQAANFMASLDDGEKTFEFGEDVGDKALTARGFMLKLLESAPAQVDYSEQTGAAQLPGSMKPEELGKRAHEYREAQAAKGITITSTQAVDAVLAGATA